MFSLPVAQLSGLLIQYKYAILFPIVVIEGPIITVIAGFLVAQGYMAFLTTYIVVVVGDVVGDVMYYAIGRWGREGFINRWGRYLGLNLSGIEKVEDHFKKHGERTLIITKLTHAIGLIAIIAAGLVRMSLFKFVRANVVGSAIKSLALVLVGYYFGQLIGRINSVLQLVSYLTVIVVASVAVSAFAYNYYNKEY